MKRIKNRIIFICIIIIFYSFMMGATPKDEWTPTQHKLHQIAELAREIGLEEDNPIIQEASFLWYTELEEVKILANVIYPESNNCTDRHQQLVATVVINRKNSDEFPDTIKEVITQKNQYNPSYVENLPNYLTSDKEMKRCFKNAILAYCGKVECPNNVLFQSNYPDLGTEYYEVIEIKNSHFHSITYFAYG